MRKLRKTDFGEKTIAYKLDLSGILYESPLHELIIALNSEPYLCAKQPNGNIMEYGVICNHDSGFMCEHRLQWIINFIKENYAQNKTGKAFPLGK